MLEVLISRGTKLYLGQPARVTQPARYLINQATIPFTADITLSASSRTSHTHPSTAAVIQLPRPVFESDLQTRPIHHEGFSDRGSCDYAGSAFIRHEHRPR
ncbi:hypothetical protein PGTUg99_006510 [Puccinia graminis f. sp. tritici]|uniref:Uncharacterized protein n=1 Tax=Puccinia graminis f. sp. tritici TaxID=56615 RepID=A0A5B0SG74_PUCGR|nr:hypothetical protein PGTUg99_006510 [Puccinia graminis f. sp. tritici]